MNQHIAELQSIYNVVGPYFLSDFYQPDGEKRLYEFLKSTYKPVFENNVRIVIVQDCQDEYDYLDLPGRAICTLQKYASQIDISNFFILVLSANINIDTELDQARQLFSTDSVCISGRYINESTYNKPVYKKQDTFCILPWIHLYVGPDSNVLPCCVADRQHPMGSVNDQSADSILKSPKFNYLRQNMLEGRRSKECNRCYQQEDSGLLSDRQKHNSTWKHRITDYNSDGSIDEFNPLYIDLRLNNICNLKCRMCSGYFSSAIAQEDLRLFKKSKNTNIVVEKESTLDEIFGYMATVEKIYFAGGEPLITNEHYKILHALIECNNTDVEIFYNTNFTSLEYKNILVTDLWKKFTNVTIGASLDGMGNVAEYIRHGSQWNNIENNLRLLKSQCPHVDFTITSVAGCLNVSSLIELQKTWQENNIVDISKFSVSAMVGPDHLTLQILPEHHKTKLREKITLHIDWCRQNQAVALARQWENVLNYMLAKDCSYLLPEFRRITIALDQHRQESFLHTFPEFVDLLE
jgi:MoaA/NifB/PqqE/SkfB family radical SAM enzyme